MSDVFLVWSIEHNAWWRPSHYGYTRDIRDAGRYPRDEARAIVNNANVVRCEECMIPVECLACPVSHTCPLEE
jgi:hypothetical protein